MARLVGRVPVDKDLLILRVALLPELVRTLPLPTRVLGYRKADSPSDSNSVDRGYPISIVQNALSFLPRAGDCGVPSFLVCYLCTTVHYSWLP